MTLRLRRVILKTNPSSHFKLLILTRKLGEMEGIRGDHRGEGDEEEAHDVEGRSGVNEDSSRDGIEDDMELDDEDPSDDDSVEFDVSDDKEDRLEDGDCEDDEDRRIFGGTDISKRDYLDQVLPLKHNDPKMKVFVSNVTDLSNEAWARLGGFLSKILAMRVLFFKIDSS